MDTIITTMMKKDKTEFIVRVLHQDIESHLSGAFFDMLQFEGGVMNHIKDVTIGQHEMIVTYDLQTIMSDWEDEIAGGMKEQDVHNIIRNMIVEKYQTYIS